MSQAPLQNEKPPPDVVIKAYRQMLTALFIGTLVAVSVGFVFFLPFLYNYFWLRHTDTSDPPLLATVMLTGALGAFFSALTRLYNFDALPKVLVHDGLDLPTPQLLMYSLIPPVVGAIAALVLYLTFAGHLITGDLFPTIDCNELAKDGTKACHNFSALLSSDGPVDATAFAKVIVWSFIAGFAERLVPNTLNVLSKAVANK